LIPLRLQRLGQGVPKNWATRRLNNVDVSSEVIFDKILARYVVGPYNTNVGPQQSPDSVLKSVDKSIFVGSSSADRDLALQVSQYLTSLPGVDGNCWVDEFPLGLLTFEALERMLRICAGAVFILATADPNGRPNDNVLIEVGLVSGRMGRRRVAICTNGGIHLPSDLDAVSRIENIVSSPGANTAQTEIGAPARIISSCAGERLKDWANSLPAILHGSPCTQVLHGYSGHWRVVLSFEKWRNRDVGNDIAVLNADALLNIPQSGQAGSGTLVGQLTLSWKPSGDKPAYTGLFNVCSSFSNIACQGNGGMTLRTQMRVWQTILQNGNPSPEEAFPEQLTAPWISKWDMKPANSDPGLMEVTFKTVVPSGWTVGKGSAYRESTNSLW
jgi:hypothetical protein